MVCAGRLFGLPVALVGKSVAGIDTRSAGKGGDFGKYPFAARSIAFGAIGGKKFFWEMSPWRPPPSPDAGRLAGSDLPVF
jgi:hypothetical protein